MKTLRQLVQSTIREFLLHGDDIFTVVDIYQEIKSITDDVIISQHPIYNDETLSFGAIRKTIENLYKEGWFSARRSIVNDEVEYSQVEAGVVENDVNSERAISNEYSAFLHKTSPEVSENIDYSCEQCDCDTDEPIIGGDGGHGGVDDSDCVGDVDSDSDSDSDSDYYNEQDRNYVEYSDLIFLVLEVLQEFKSNSEEFSAYDVTKQLRINNPDLEIVHENVKSIIAELFQRGLFYDEYYSQHVKRFGKQYIEYLKVESTW